MELIKSGTDYIVNGNTEKGHVFDSLTVTAYVDIEEATIEGILVRLVVSDDSMAKLLYLADEGEEEYTHPLLDEWDGEISFLLDQADIWHVGKEIKFVYKWDKYETVTLSLKELK
jgi:hypothetical protein